MSEYSCRKLESGMYAYLLRVRFDEVRWVDGKPCIGTDQIWHFRDPTCAEVLNSFRTMEEKAVVMQ